MTGTIALLTDFGTRDWYVATLKGVILSRCPQARFVDITHEIPPQDVVAGAFTLAAAAPWFPAGTVFLAVVDPEVGSERALIAVRADERYFVGPDNGVLTLSVERAARRRIVRLTNRRYWLPDVSRTFHGRDMLAPVAAYLAGGGSMRSLGESTTRLTELSLPRVTRRGRVLQGAIVHIDAFGNLVTNLPAKLIANAQPARPRAVRYQQASARVVSSYSAGRANELIALAGSLGLVELAIRAGSAAWTLNARRGEPVELVLG